MPLEMVPFNDLSVVCLFILTVVLLFIILGLRRCSLRSLVTLWDSKRRRKKRKVVKIDADAFPACSILKRKVVKIDADAFPACSILNAVQGHAVPASKVVQGVDVPAVPDIKVVQGGFEPPSPEPKPWPGYGTGWVRRKQYHPFPARFGTLNPSPLIISWKERFPAPRQTWLQEIRRQGPESELEDVEDETQIQEDVASGTDNSIPRMSMEAKGKKTWISTVDKEAFWEETISKDDAQRHKVQHEKMQGAHGLIGMESYVIRVLHFLECTTLSRLGISGRRGVGKTTLLRLVHDHLVDFSKFDCVFCIESTTGTLGGVQQAILDTILGRQCQIPNALTPEEYISSFLKGKSFLLLLDNLREPIDLFALGLPMPLENRQKVIITTINNAICAEIGCAGNTIQMQCLGEAEAWELFKAEVQNKCVDTHPVFKCLAKQIVQECQGLPIALSTFGRALAIRRDIKEWRHVCNLLKVKRPL